MQQNSSSAFIAFELGVGALGLLLTWWLFGSPFYFKLDANMRVWGVVLVLGLPLALLAVLVTSPRILRRVGFLRRIYKDLRDSAIGEFIMSSNGYVFLMLSLAAGFSEELLFRGVAQAKMGLWLSALLFGLLHALSWAYFVITTLIGIYFGWMFEFTNGNLFIPSFLHAAYDFAVLLLLRKTILSNPVLE